MTPHERWQAVLQGRKPDRVPCDFWGTAEVTARLRCELGCASDRELWERLGVDKCIHLAARHPLAKEDEWHIPSSFDEEWNVSDLHARCQEWAGYPIVACASEPFYLYCHLRGMEQAMQDLLLNPAIVEAALERIQRIFSGLFRRTLDAAADLVDFVYVAEDLGTQDSLLMSPASFRKFLKPRMARMIELAHSYGVRVIHHDDGAIRPLLPDLIEIGIDVLNPIQWRCRGMEREGLARDFGASVVFHGGVDNQKTLPFGRPEDVRQEVADNLRIFRDGKGYIVAPCHNIQANTPTENILALYEAVHDLGRV
jgi:uroporphyrinogen decarboxylase